MYEKGETITKTKYFNINNRSTVREKKESVILRA